MSFSYDKSHIKLLTAVNSQQFILGLDFCIYIYHCVQVCMYQFPWWLSGKEPTCQCRRCRFDPWIRKVPWRRKQQPTLVFLSGKFHGQRSPVGYSPCGGKELDITQLLNNNNGFYIHHLGFNMRNEHWTFLSFPFFPYSAAELGLKSICGFCMTSQGDAHSMMLVESLTQQKEKLCNTQDKSHAWTELLNGLLSGNLF